jgi:hypothetical protein
MKRLIILFLCAGSFACKQNTSSGVTATSNTGPVIPAHRVREDDTAIQIRNGIWMRQDKPYSGQLISLYPSGIVRSVKSLWEGKEEGLQITYYEDGALATQRWYRNGEKDSVNQGWWPDGKQKFLYHFKAGVYEGSFEEWYASGKPLKKIWYHDGKEQCGQGWRENGKPFMSFVVKDGRWYGQINPNLCYSLTNEKGDFAAVRQ